MTVRTIWGREPAVWLALFAALVQGVSGFFFNLTDDQQGVLNAVAVAFFGLVTALAVKGDALLPGLMGFIKAVLALGLAFGLHLDAAHQSVIMVIAGAIVTAFVVRPNVTAPVTMNGQLAAVPAATRAG
jgi:hypothetical protein